MTEEIGTEKKTRWRGTETVSHAIATGNETERLLLGTRSAGRAQRGGPTKVCLSIAFIFVRLRWWILTCTIADEKKSSRRQSRRQKDGHDAPRCQVHTRPHFVACVGLEP